MNKQKNYIIGIAGGSSSGKTFLCKKLVKKYNNINTIKVDSYYKDLKKLEFKEREKVNFDHPSAFEFNLLIKHLHDMQKNKKIKIPIYDYKNHIRSKESYYIDKNNNLIIIEGIFSLYKKEIRDMLSLSIFLDIPNSIRKKRRLIRDKENRKRSISSIRKQYEKTVEPMYTKHVEPTKKYADIVIKEFTSSDIGYLKLINKIEKFIKK